MSSIESVSVSRDCLWSLSKSNQSFNRPRGKTFQHKEVSLLLFQNKNVFNTLNVLFMWGWLGTSTCYLEGLLSLHPWRYSRGVWTRSWALCSSRSCFSRWGGQGDVQRPLPISTILWLNCKLYFVVGITFPLPLQILMQYIYCSLCNGKKSIAVDGEKKGFGDIAAAGNIQTGVSPRNLLCFRKCFLLIETGKISLLFERFALGILGKHW